MTFVTAVLFLANVFFAHEAAQRQNTTQRQNTALRQDITQLSWMAGCWQMVDSEEVTEEQWMGPRAGMMMGMSRTVRNGKVTVFETTRIEQHGDVVVFSAQPSGQPGGSFPAKVVSLREAVFEELKHDFPQRVIYRNGGDSLLASIEGMQNGKLVTVPFPMKRTECAGNRTAAGGVGPE
jgi:hypothetical protein